MSTESNASQAVAYLRSRLASGELAPGTRLTEEGLAKDLGISRTPVREAIRALVADGFLRFKPNSGTFVAEWTDDDIRQIFDLRTILEGQIAESAALNMTREELVSLGEIQARMDVAAAARGEGAMQQRSALNREFHALIARASRKDRMEAALKSAISMPIVQQTFRRYTPGQAARSLAHHRELLDAFKARDPLWARAVMTSHIRAALDALTVYNWDKLRRSKK
jgi:DNA-binding GntR family transcriptional regulator